MKRGQYVTLDEHLPKSQREYGQWSPERLLNWAGKVGPNTAALAQKILESRPHPMLAYRYKSVKAILEKGLDAVAFDEPANNSPVVHENLRGAAYYSN